MLWLGASGAWAQGPTPTHPEAAEEQAFQLRLCPPMAPGCYHDADGLWRNPSHEYALELASQQPNAWRAAGWSAAVLAGGILWYWIERDQNAVDWDLDSWTMRFQRQAYRYDANDFPINALWHPLAGAAFYGLARANGLSVLGSTATAVLASFAWEFLLEFKERVSVNDTLVTPVAGIALGEYLFRLGRYLGSAPGGGRAKHKALRWSVGLPVALNDAWDGRATPPADEPANDSGFGTRTTGEFLLGVSASLNRGSADPFAQYEGFMRSRLTAIPGYLREGDFKFVFTDANISSLSIRAGGGQGRGGEIRAEAVLTGVHRQRIRMHEGELRGGALTAGMSVDYLYRRLDYESFHDLVGTVGLPGLMLEGRWLVGSAVLTAGVRAHAQFASTSSLAYARWREEHPGVRTQSVLESAGYYFGWGGAGRLLLEAQLPWLRFGTSLLVGAYHSRNGLDRKQEKIEADLRLQDRQLNSETWLGFVVPRIGLYLGLSTTTLLRHSYLANFDASGRLQRVAFELGFSR